MRKRSKFNRILSFVMSLSLVAGDTLPAFAADGDSPEAEAAVVSIDEAQEEEESVEEASTEEEPLKTAADDAVSDDDFVFVPGYLANPFEAESPALDPNISYRESRARLSGDPSIEYETVHATNEASTAKASDSAFPYSHNGEWLAYFTSNYPATRDQNPYGSCWAHSAMCLAEFNLISHEKANKNIDLSELHLVYWSYNQGTPSEAAGDTGDRVSFSPTSTSPSVLDNGGSHDFAVQQFIRQRGFALESVAPYTQKDYIAGGGSLDADTERNDAYFLQNAYKIDITKPENRSRIKEAIIDNGAVGVSYFAATGSNPTYYNAFYNGAYSAYYCYSNFQSNHAVSAVGWDDNFPKEYFKQQPSSDGAWLIRNSWSTTSKEDYTSYFWMSYEDASLVGGWVYEVATDFPYDNHYYYDSAIHGSVYFSGGTRQYANIYTVSGEDELLEAVDFEVSYLESSNTGYTVEVYKNPQAGNPSSGTKVSGATASGVLDYTGVYTVKLAEPAEFEAGDTFSVVVKFDSSASLAIETKLDDYGGVSSTAGASSGQSFISSSGSSWTDVYNTYGAQGLGNVCLGALTKDVNQGEDLSHIDIDPAAVSFDSKGATQQLDVKVYSRAGVLNPNASVTYTSSNENVAAVSSKGLITAKGSGTAVITAKSGKLSAECTVSVTVAKTGNPTVDKEENSILYPGDILNVSCPTDGATVYYTTNGSAPTTGSTKVNDGKITVKGSAGDYILKLRAFSDQFDPSDIVTYTYTLDSKAGLVLDKTSLELDSTVYTAFLSAKLYDDAGDEVSGAKFTWETSDPSVVKVSNGNVTAAGSGTAVITATSGDYSAACNVSVNFDKTAKPVSDKSSKVLKVGDSIALASETNNAQIYYTLDGSKPDKKSNLYSGKIAVTSDMIDQTITLKAVAYAYYHDPSEMFTYTFDVESKAGISLSVTTVNLTSEHPSTRLNATVYTYDGKVDTSATVSWTSEDESVATVNDGVVTAAGKGKTVITAASGKYSAQCEVNVEISKVAAPTVDAEEGTVFSIGDVINVACSSTDAKIRYTLEGSEPTKVSALADGSIKIGRELAGKTFTLKLRAFADYYEASDIVSIDYSVEDLSKLVLSKSIISFTEAGASEKLTALVYDASGNVSSNAVISWSSSDENVATVDKGVVTAVASGNAVITASSGSHSAKCDVVVVTMEERDPSVSTNIIIEPEELELNGIGKTAQINVTVTDQYGLIISKPALSFESSDENIVTVSKTGAVRSVSAGDAVITVKSGEISAECKVKVTLTKLAKPVASVNAETHYKAGMEIGVKCESAGAEIRYTTDGSDPTEESALLNGKFAITKEMAGRTVSLKLRAFADGFEASDVSSYEIEVEDLSAIELSATKISFKKLEISQYLQASVYDAAGEEDEDAEVSWKSSDTAVVTVVNGKVTAVGEGKAVITASSGDLKAECEVLVKLVSDEEPSYPDYISVDPSVVRLTAKGGKKQLKVYVEDQNGLVIEDPVLTFESSDEDIATVDDQGVITAVSNGYAVICVMCGDVYEFCDVYVNISEDPVDPVDPVEKEMFTVSFYVGGMFYSSVEVEKGKCVDILPEDVGEGFLGWVDRMTGNAWNPTSPVYSDLILDARFAEDEHVSAFDPVPDMNEIDVYMVKGQKFQLRGSWESSDPSVVNISKKGLLTAKKADSYGTLIYNAENEDDYRIVYVVQPSIAKTLTVQAGKAEKIEIDLSGLNEEYEVAWTSSAPSIAVVNGGAVFGIAKGSATITATVNGKAYSCKVKVVDTEKTKVDVYTTKLTLAPMQSVATKIKGEWTADGQKMSNIGTPGKPVFANKVVSITAAGKITAIGCGTTKLSANGRNITVTVSEPVEQIQYIAKGKNKTLKFTSVKSAQGRWESSDPSVATVDAKGKVVAVNTGVAVISCIYNPNNIAGAGFTYVTRVYVENPKLENEDGLSRGKNDYTYTCNVKAGDTVPIRFSQDKGYAVYQPVVYKSSKNSVAYVDECGVIHAIGSGKTKITTKINGKALTVTVNVE